MDIASGKYLGNLVLVASVSQWYPSLPVVVAQLFCLEVEIRLTILMSPVVIMPAIAKSHQISLVSLVDTSQPVSSSVYAP